MEEKLFNLVGGKKGEGRTENSKNFLRICLGMIPHQQKQLLDVRKNLAENLQKSPSYSNLKGIMMDEMGEL